MFASGEFAVMFVRSLETVRRNGLGVELDDAFRVDEASSRIAEIGSGVFDEGDRAIDRSVVILESSNPTRHRSINGKVSSGLSETSERSVISVHLW